MSVILTQGSVPTLTTAQRKIKNVSYRLSKRQRDMKKPGPVTVIQLVPRTPVTA